MFFQYFWQLETFGKVEFGLVVEKELVGQELDLSGTGIVHVVICIINSISKKLHIFREIRVI
jgi:hypothetical protein